MSLRDYFAAEALPAILQVLGPYNLEKVGLLAYQMADQMLSAQQWEPGYLETRLELLKK